LPVSLAKMFTSLVVKITSPNYKMGFREGQRYSDRNYSELLKIHNQ